jgi:hypothetical protein
VPLSNQRHQNKKPDLDEFDEFSLLVPPLDDDLFASLSVTDIAAMEATPDHDEDGSGREYEEEEGEDDDEWSPLFIELLFPLWYLDAKVGEEYLVILICHMSFSMRWMTSDLLSSSSSFFFPLWCACKNLITLLMLV